MGDADTRLGATTPAIEGDSTRGRGRPPTHGLKVLRRAVTKMTTKRLDGRSAVAVRRWKDDVACDLGNDLSRAQTTLLEAATQSYVILSSLDDWIARQPSLVTKKRTVQAVVMQRMQIAEGLARQLERLGLERRAQPVQTLEQYLAERRTAAGEGTRDGASGVAARGDEERHDQSALHDVAPGAESRAAGA